MRDVAISVKTEGGDFVQFVVSSDALIPVVAESLCVDHRITMLIAAARIKPGEIIEGVGIVSIVSLSP